MPSGVFEYDDAASFGLWRVKRGICARKISAMAISLEPVLT